MTNITLGEVFSRELAAEVESTRKCLERVPADLYNWKPHEKSMIMGYLAQVIAEIPRWISTAIEEGTVNFGTWKSVEMKTADDFVREFEKNVAGAKAALAKVSDEELLNGQFTVASGDKVLMKDSKFGTVQSSINHMVHHRAQLTVYLRLNNIPVPKIYGPSADEKEF